MIFDIDALQVIYPSFFPNGLGLSMGFPGERGVLYGNIGIYQSRTILVRKDFLGSLPELSIELPAQVFFFSRDPHNPNVGLAGTESHIYRIDLETMTLIEQVAAPGRGTPYFGNESMYFLGIGELARHSRPDLLKEDSLPFPSGRLSSMLKNGLRDVTYGIYDGETPFLKYIAADGTTANHILRDINQVRTGVIDETNNIAYLIADSNNKLIKFNLDTFQTLGVLESDEWLVGPLVLHRIARKIYVFSSKEGATRLRRVDLATFSFDAEAVIAVSLAFADVAVDEHRGRAYFTSMNKFFGMVGIDLNAMEGGVIEAPYLDLAAPVVDPLTGKVHFSSRTRIVTYDPEAESWSEAYQFAHDAIIPDSALNEEVGEFYFAYETNYANQWYPGLIALRTGTMEKKWRVDRPELDEVRQVEFSSAGASLNVRQQTGLKRVPLGHRNYLKGSRLEMPEDGHVLNVGFYSHLAGGNVRLSIHEASPPYALLWESDVVPNETSGHHIVVPISEGSPSSLLLAEGEYLLGWQIDSMVDAPSWQQGPDGVGFMVPHIFGSANSIAAEKVIFTGDQWTQYVTYWKGLPLDVDHGLSAEWHFAEGATHPEFETYYLLANHWPESMEVDLELYPEVGPPVPFTFTLAPQSRATFRLNDLLENSGVSGKLLSRDGKPFAAERAMYLRGKDGRWIGAHASQGTMRPALDWYIVEGSTAVAGPAGLPFEMYLLIANPNSASNTVELTFLLDDGPPVVKQMTVGPHKRLTLRVDILDYRLEGRSFSTKVSSLSGEPVVVEQAMWWRHKDAEDEWYVEGNAAPGITELWNTWYLAEGGTEANDSFILLINPHSSPVDVSLAYLQEDASPILRSLTLQPRQRRTIHVNDDPDGAPDSARHGTAIHASNTIGVQRSMYRTDNAMPWISGKTGLAAPAAATAWLLAEGAEVPYADDRLHMEILIANPTDQASSVDLTFRKGDASVQTYQTSIHPGRRITVRTRDIGVQGAFSTVVRTEVPVVVEPTMYFGRPGEPPIERMAETSSLGFPLSGLAWELPPLKLSFPAGKNEEPPPVFASPTATPTVTPTRAP